MAQISSRHALHALSVLAALLFVYGMLYLPTGHRVSNMGHSILTPSAQSHDDTAQRPDSSVFDNLSLTAGQCDAAFFGLTAEIDNAVAQGEFELKNSSGALLGRIKDGRIAILRAPRRGDMSAQWRERQMAALHQLHRALLTTPAASSIPDTIFALHIQDTPFASTWSHSRPATISSSSYAHIFPIPHFAFWSWSNPLIRSLPHAAAAITTLEATLPFRNKDPRAVWRGTVWFQNGAGANPRLRQDLLQVTKNASWADILALDGGKGSAGHGMAIEAFCGYKYVVYTEGVSYSGRLPFHQLCRSVLLSPPLEWMMHTTHLVRPVYSSVLLGYDARDSKDAASEKRRGKKGGSWTSGAYPSSRATKAWPMKHAPEDANMVFVNPDWSDLEETVAWLENHPAVAEGIARRQRELFATRGYLSPAAEVCYWRALIRGWSHVVQADRSWYEIEGLSFEEFSATEEQQSRRGSRPRF